MDLIKLIVVVMDDGINRVNIDENFGHSVEPFLFCTFCLCMRQSGNTIDSSDCCIFFWLSDSFSAVRFFSSAVRFFSCISSLLYCRNVLISVKWVW